MSSETNVVDLVELVPGSLVNRRIRTTKVSTNL